VGACMCLCVGMHTHAHDASFYMHEKREESFVLIPFCVKIFMVSYIATLTLAAFAIFH